MKKNALPVLIIVGLITIVLAFIGVSAMIEKYTPSDERQDLTEYYNITEETQVAIVLDNTVLDKYATLVNGQVYLDYNFVQDYLNARFYWDSYENILLYTTATDVISAKAEATSYSVGKSSTDFGKIVVKATAESALIHMDFVNQYSNISCAYYESPNRVVITSAWGEISTTTAKNDTVARLEDNIKSPILCDIAKGTALVVLEEVDNWVKVSTSDGITGYIEAKNLSQTATQLLSSEKQEETFKHIKKDKPINLLWHQVSSANASKNAISSVLSESKGVNVISPTWFKVADNDGNIKSIASSDYVEYCHDHGVEVWGLVSDFEVDGVDIGYILTHTSSRQNLVNQLVAKAVEFNLDGINIDFEALDNSIAGEAYMQFLRELSIKLHALEISLSTDVPTYTSTNNAVYNYGEQAYFVDYIIIMGYDEHYGQESGEGSVASLSWTQNALEKTLALGVPADQIVLGMPFYTKLWILTPKIEENSAEVTYVIGFENVGMDSAKKWMNNNISQPEWLEDCGQYYGVCEKDDVIYKMWLEDTTSLEKRLQQMKEYSLAGAAFWKSGLECDEAWDVIIKYIN